ncbi:MAG: tRNA-dihydrouridine synthase family protein, partial [Limisphaerales bacterium]
GEALFVPKGFEVLNYLRDLFETVRPPEISENAHIQKMKKYMNYIGMGLEPTGEFLHAIRRVTTERDFFQLCKKFLEHDEPMPLEPFALGLKETDVMAGEHL